MERPIISEEFDFDYNDFGVDICMLDSLSGKTTGIVTMVAYDKRNSNEPIIVKDLCLMDTKIKSGEPVPEPWLELLDKLR